MRAGTAFTMMVAVPEPLLMFDWFDNVGQIPSLPQTAYFELLRAFACSCLAGLTHHATTTCEAAPRTEIERAWSRLGR